MMKNSETEEYHIMPIFLIDGMLSNPIIMIHFIIVSMWVCELHSKAANSTLVALYLPLYVVFQWREESTEK